MTPSDTAGLVARLREGTVWMHSSKAGMGEIDEAATDALMEHAANVLEAQSLSRPVEGRWVMVKRAHIKALAEGYFFDTKDDRYILIDNPDYAPDNGSDPKLVIDVDALQAAPVFPTPVMGEGGLNELRLHNIALTDALRKVAIVKMYKPDGKGGHKFERAICEICAAECGPEQRITHVDDCPLTVLNEAATPSRAPVMGEERMREILARQFTKTLAEDHDDDEPIDREARLYLAAIWAMREVAQITGGNRR